MKEKIIILAIAVGAFFGGFAVANLDSSCSCGIACACADCSCTK